METIMLHLKIVRRVWGVQLAYVVSVKEAHILLGYEAYLNLNKS